MIENHYLIFVHIVFFMNYINYIFKNDNVNFLSFIDSILSLNFDLLSTFSFIRVVIFSIIIDKYIEKFMKKKRKLRE